MKKILVPCDFSETAVQAFRFALDIADKSNGEVILLNVIELPVMYDTVLMPTLNFEESLMKELKEETEKNFKKLKDKWSQENVRVSSFVEYGPVTLSIARFVEEKKVDLMVMGTKGVTGMKEFLVGSNTEKLVRRSPVPVIAVKKYKKISTIKDIVFPNALDEEQEDLIMKVKEMQEFFKAKLHLLYVNTPSNFKQDADTYRSLEKFIKRFMLKDVTVNIYNDFTQEGGVIHFTQEMQADMIAMGTHGRKGISHLVSGSVTEDVVNHIECPIWTCVTK